MDFLCDECSYCAHQEDRYKDSYLDISCHASQAVRKEAQLNQHSCRDTESYDEWYHSGLSLPHSPYYCCPHVYLFIIRGAPDSESTHTGQGLAAEEGEHRSPIQTTVDDLRELVNMFPGLNFKGRDEFFHVSSPPYHLSPPGIWSDLEELNV